MRTLEEILVGIDYGGRRTGLAFGRAGLTSPIKVVESEDPNVVISEVARVVIENRATKLVVGLPLDLDGKETKQSIEVRRFAKLLKIRVKRPVIFVSEFDTSQEALSRAIRSGLSKKGRKTTDHYSAELILRRYYAEIKSEEKRTTL